MTDKTEFDNLRTLRAATTPGEWRIVEPGERPTISAPTGAALATVHQWHGRDDAAFIVAAHNELPALLAHLDEVTAERNALAAVIKKAPHDSGCDSDWGGVCDCWKSAAPSSVLAAHDAKVRAEALREAADEYKTPSLGTSTSGVKSYVPDWLRARAAKEENR